MSSKKHYIRDCIVSEFAKKSGKKIKLINVVSIASVQIIKNKNVLHHFFMLITLYINTIMITIKAIIDSKIIYHFIFQFKIKKHNFVEIDIQFQNFRCLDDIALKI